MNSKTKIFSFYSLICACFSGQTLREKEIKIYRGEIYKAIVEENKQAINNVAAVDLSNITFK